MEAPGNIFADFPKKSEDITFSNLEIEFFFFVKVDIWGIEIELKMSYAENEGTIIALKMTIRKDSPG